MALQAPRRHTHTYMARAFRLLVQTKTRVFSVSMSNTCQKTILRRPFRRKKGKFRIDISKPEHKQVLYGRFGTKNAYVKLKRSFGVLKFAVKIT